MHYYGKNMYCGPKGFRADMHGILYNLLCQPCVLEAYVRSQDLVYAHMDKIWLIGVHTCPIWHM